MEARRQELLADLHAVNPSEWGPHLWRILHWLAEQVGNQKSKILQGDEINAWKKLFRIVANIVPCAMCKGHYLEYLKANIDVEKIGFVEGDERREFIRRWLWELHEDVNKRREVQGIPFDSLSEICGSIDFIVERDALYEALMRALRKNIVTRDNITQFKTAINTLFGMYRVLTKR